MARGTPKGSSMTQEQLDACADARRERYAACNERTRFMNAFRKQHNLANLPLHENLEQDGELGRCQKIMDKLVVIERKVDTLLEKAGVK